MYLVIWHLFMCMHGAVIFAELMNTKHSICATIYASVNVFRSLLPRLDGTRICMFNTFLSTPLVGRSLATISEMAFIIQIRQWTQLCGLEETIFFAQAACWAGCLTGHQGFHVMEETLWTICAIRVAIDCFIRRRFLECGVASMYIAYMVTVDIPMYASRTYPSQSMLQGFHQMAACSKNVDPSVWRDDIVWMTGYFIGGTQISLFLDLKNAERA